MSMTVSFLENLRVCGNSSFPTFLDLDVLAQVILKCILNWAGVAVISSDKLLFLALEFHFSFSFLRVHVKWMGHHLFDLLKYAIALYKIICQSVFEIELKVILTSPCMHLYVNLKC